MSYGSETLHLTSDGFGKICLQKYLDSIPQKNLVFPHSPASWSIWADKGSIFGSCKQFSKEAKKSRVKSLKVTDPKTRMKKIKDLGKANHEISDDNWQFIDEHKDNQTLTEDIAEYFATINTHMTPIDRSKNVIPPPHAPFVCELHST